MESQENGSSSLEKSAMFEESQSAMSLQNVASETSSTMQETMVMTNMQETKVTQEMHQEVHQKVHQEMHREMLLSEEVEEMHVSSEERQETSWASSQSESSTCERSQTSSSMSLTERFAADSQQRYASTQETLRIPEVETKKKEEAKVESGCILGKHMKVIKAAMEELEMGEKKLEEQLDPSDTEHLHRRRQMSEQPSIISLDTTTISATNIAKDSDEETIMTTTTLKDTTEWESTTCKETDDGDTTAKETEDEGEEETETEDEETISMRKKIGAVFLTECSSSQVSLLKIFIPYPNFSHNPTLAPRMTRRHGGKRKGNGIERSTTAICPAPWSTSAR